MYERFTDRARKVMQLANQEARSLCHDFIGTEHILLGLIKEGSGVAANVLKNLDIDPARVRQEVVKIVTPGPVQTLSGMAGKLPQTPRAKQVIQYSIEEARGLNHNYVGTEHLLLGLLREREGLAAQVLMNLGLRLDSVREEILQLLGHDIAPTGAIHEDFPTLPISGTPTLDTCGRDLTALARAGKLDPVIGRQQEIDRLAVVLCRRHRNSPVLVGPAGVGKTAIVEGLAQRIAGGNVPDVLRARRIVALDLAGLYAGARDRGQWLERACAVSNEIRRAGNVLLYIDDPRLLIGSPGLMGSRTAARVLRPALARGEWQCVVAATPGQSRDFLATDVALGRRLQPVTVSPPSPEETLAFLRLYRERYEEHHRVVIADEALQAAVELSALFLPDQCWPGKALDLMDEAAARLRLAPAALPSGDEADQLARQIEKLTCQKEEAVADQDFDLAVRLRDQCDRLKQQRDQLHREWRPAAQAAGRVADGAAVIAALSGMTGIAADLIRNRDTSALPRPGG
jgi:ATP-dependent Clp protease ATP-binding subunit ClpC